MPEFETLNHKKIPENFKIPEISYYIEDQIESKGEAIEPAVEKIIEKMKSMGWNAEACHWVKLGISEILANAIKKINL